MIQTEKNKIFARIYFKEKYSVDLRETRQSLIPNTIHCYDASVMHLAIQICKKIKINVLCIHDSMGCAPLALPMVKIIFKIANILIIEINSKKKIFPINTVQSINERELQVLFDNIINSKNFFK
jgi:DNA-directed RNA polymerase